MAKAGKKVHYQGRDLRSGWRRRPRRPKADVKKFFAALEGLVVNQLGKKGPGVITLPGIVKLTAIKKPASKGGEQRPNPFKPGEFIITKPKPASVKVRARALKAFARRP